MLPRGSPGPLSPRGSEQDVRSARQQRGVCGHPAQQRQRPPPTTSRSAHLHVPASRDHAAGGATAGDTDSKGHPAAGLAARGDLPDGRAQSFRGKIGLSE